MFLDSLALVITSIVLVTSATSGQTQPPFNGTKNANETTLSALFTQNSNPLNTVFAVSTRFSNITDTMSLTISMPSNVSSAENTTPATFLSSSIPPLSVSPMSPSISTILVTEFATVFETTTVTGNVTATVPPTANISVTATTTTTTSLGPSPVASWDNRTLWVAPPQMTDLSAFNVTHFPSGRRNLHIVDQVPAEAISPTAQSLQSSVNDTSPNMFSILKLVYPAHSVNPGSKPVGGADFYATPLNLAGARNATLAYRVFFPADFNWVKGGKLPGLFGGHTGCSGGASASDCFSTRMMWRPQGAGELYLYAPKDKQTDALCADIGSVCDATYGFSIGRGTFNFTAGDWTSLEQHIVLNTPGKNDGAFTLFVNGRLTINRTDVFYRDVDPDSDSDDPQGTAEFIGLFFSTFFGGHGKKYATPRQQFAWFKDFAIARHD